ncbi:hypothetical protein N0B31_17715 [Salinirubellus salinus]|uniref:Lipoprotein n=1 Tax=Salinirubellus salinus TaxID=1364945 RepID=A0A9E7R3G5_9EURY|nr:hypothetical protein [Salinirubellus salinus]UWM53950.1 hypothetical protein N0B31_17715 [Salinirubellus salinus]
MKGIDRRQLLTVAGVSIVTGLAGCLGGGEDEAAPEASAEPTPNRDSSGAGTSTEASVNQTPTATPNSSGFVNEIPTPAPGEVYTRTGIESSVDTSCTGNFDEFDSQLARVSSKPQLVMLAYVSAPANSVELSDIEESYDDEANTFDLLLNFAVDESADTCTTTHEFVAIYAFDKDISGMVGTLSMSVNDGAPEQYVETTM